MILVQEGWSVESADVTSAVSMSRVLTGRQTDRWVRRRSSQPSELVMTTS